MNTSCHVFILTQELTFKYYFLNVIYITFGSPEKILVITVKYKTDCMFTCVCVRERRKYEK